MVQMPAIAVNDRYAARSTPQHIGRHILPQFPVASDAGEEEDASGRKLRLILDKEFIDHVTGSIEINHLFAPRVTRWANDIFMPPTSVVDWHSDSAYPFRFDDVIFRKNIHRDGMLQRIAFLRAEAQEEDAAFSEASASHLMVFCDDLAADKRPAIVLMQNGNVRAVWQSRPAGQIGIQFLPNGELQFVLSHEERGELLQTMGIEKAQTIKRHVASTGLRYLWFDG